MAEDRKTTLLKATYDLLKICEESNEHALGVQVYYDGTNLDGSCLMEDIAMELEIEEN